LMPDRFSPARRRASATSVVTGTTTSR
jgi:hypothetical protein